MVFRFGNSIFDPIWNRRITAAEIVGVEHRGGYYDTSGALRDMVEAGWTVLRQVLAVWQALPQRNFPNHPAGTWGPPEADELMQRRSEMAER